MSANIPPTVIIGRDQPGCLLTILWFVFVGWWLSAIWIGIAWLFIVLIIPMPIGLMMLNRAPRIATLRQPTSEYVVATSGTATRIQAVGVRQHPFLIRAIYFIVVGWWLSFIWIWVAWAAGLTLVGFPLSIWMLNRIPAVTTLARY
jgi:uncharacterized membrane protein YccF (DUF307 family)